MVMCDRTKCSLKQKTGLEHLNIPYSNIPPETLLCHVSELSAVWLVQ